MKVLVVSHTYVVDLNREKWRQFVDLDPTIEINIVLPKWWNPGGVQKNVIESGFVSEGQLVVTPVANYGRRKQGLLTFGPGLIHVLQDFQPDIIQVEQGQFAFTYAQSIVLNKLLGIGAKNVFFTWWNLRHSLALPVRLLESFNLKHTDGAVCGNQEGADILRERGFTGPLITLPQLGVDEHRFKPSDEQELAQNLGIRSTDFVIGFVGRFVREKGLFTLLESLKLLSARRQDLQWKCLLLGRGPMRQELEQAVKAAGLHERFIWTESVAHNDVPKYLNLLNTLLLPSQTSTQLKTLAGGGWKEQFGHVLIEAMACAVPVIGSDSGEIPHVIGNAGLVFPEGNFQALCECLLKLIDDRAFAESLGKHGLQRCLEKYTNRVVAAKLFEFYKSLSS